MLSPRAPLLVSPGDSTTPDSPYYTPETALVKGTLTRSARSKGRFLSRASLYLISHHSSVGLSSLLLSLKCLLWLSDPHITGSHLNSID